MTVTEGMDSTRVREIAQQIRGSAQSVGDVRQSGDGQLALLKGAWSGPDLEDFDEGWGEQSPALDQMAEKLRQAADDLVRQADSQDDASGGGGGGSSTPSPWAGDKSAPSDPPWKQFLDKDFGLGIFGHGDGSDDDDDDDDDGKSLFGKIKDAGGDVVDKVKDVGEGAVDKAKDVGDKVTDFGKDAVDTVKDGASWLGGKAKDGLSWLGGKASDGLSWIGNQAKQITAEIRDYLDNVGDAFMRFADAGKNLAGQFTQIFTEGRLPRFSEVVASVAMVYGTAAGVLTNIFTGDDKHLFDDGRGEAGEVTELGDKEVTNSAGKHPELRQPTSLDEILRSTSDAYEVKGEDGSGSVRVTEVTKADGTTSYIVNVPGTERWSPATNANPLDLTGNLASVSGEKTAGMQAVEDALAEAGVPSDAPILLVGHSQGGIITNGLLSDPGFTDKYNVTHSVTYGAPVDGFDIPDDVQALNLQHRGDVVPRLDLGDAYASPGGIPAIPNPGQILHGNGPGETRVVLDSPGLGLNPIDNHSHSLYANSVEGSNDPALRAYEEGLDDFIVSKDDGSQVSGRDVEVRRAYDD